MLLKNDHLFCNSRYLKGLSLMGVATGPKGKLLVTDMDTIETSNLSRCVLVLFSAVFMLFSAVLVLFWC